MNEQMKEHVGINELLYLGTEKEETVFHSAGWCLGVSTGFLLCPYFVPWQQETHANYLCQKTTAN
jgi:hypothetical protein